MNNLLAAITLTTLLPGLATASQVETKTAESMHISGNKLYSQPVGELRAVYANKGGQSCITYSKILRGDLPETDYYTKNQLAYSEHHCKGFAQVTPYSLDEIIDPKAISNFQLESSRASCADAEKHVNGRFIKRSPKCEKFYRSQVAE